MKLVIDINYHTEEDAILAVKAGGFKHDRVDMCTIELTFDRSRLEDIALVTKELIDNQVPFRFEPGV